MTPKKNNIVTVQNVSLQYQTRSGIIKKFKHIALNNVSFEIQYGKTYGILGRNGSGKSSLLLLLSGLIEPTSGQIICDSNLRRALLTIGLGFRPDLSGRDNAILSTMLNGATKTEALHYIDEIRDFSCLGAFFNQPVRTYSAGMRSRLGFSTAIKTDVDLLLVDEVLSVGDAKFKQKAEKALLKKMNSNQTVVFVSHAVEQVLKICDQALWLDNGEIKTIGKTKDVVEKYKNYVDSDNSN